MNGRYAEFGLSFEISSDLVDTFDALNGPMSALKAAQKACLDDMTARTWCSVSHAPLSDTCWHCSLRKQLEHFWWEIVYYSETCEECAKMRWACECVRDCCCGCCD